MKTKKWGPGLLVTAAFVGPGTVTLASQSGAKYGFALLWVVLISMFTAIVFQEMAARLGVVTGRDLSEALRTSGKRPWLKWLTMILVLGAILVGNAAYQAGNISGATTGLSVLTGWEATTWAWMISAVAAVLLMSGRFMVIQTALIFLVAVMSILFVLSAVLVRPNLGDLWKGFAIPTIPDGALLNVVGLLGTTVVPYNLFLHSRSAVETWYAEDHSIREKRQAVKQAWTDTLFSISLGGLITVSILVSAAVAFFQKNVELQNLAEIAAQLRPVLGAASETVFCLGLAAAGLTSAITAPLAAGITVAGCFGWGNNLADLRTRAIMLGVLGVGLTVILTLSGKSPQQIIVLAQVANGIILPVIAIFLLYVMNQSKVLGEFKNRWASNLLGGILIVFVTILAARQFYAAGTTMANWFGQ